MNLILIGPPGAGKGTQAKYLVKRLNNFQISTGDMLREEIQNDSEIGKKILNDMNDGKFVSDQIVNTLIENVLLDPKKRGRLIFDGYPRSLTQAENLEQLLKKTNQTIDFIFFLNVNKETIIERIKQRKIIEKRADDDLETIIKRYDTYEKSSSPVIEYYKQSNLLKVINGEASISEINSEISGLIEGIKG